MKQIKLAVEDCTAALNLDPKYGVLSTPHPPPPPLHLRAEPPVSMQPQKYRIHSFTRAYTRRGRCHLELNDFEKGIADFKSAQKCGGNSNDVADLLRDAERRRDAKADFYTLLGVSRTFSNSCEKTKKDLKQKYKNLCLRWHPDKVRGNDEDQQQAEKKFKQVGEAYATLSDAVRRREYDRTLAPSLRSFATAVCTRVFAVTNPCTHCPRKKSNNAHNTHTDAKPLPHARPQHEPVHPNSVRPCDVRWLQRVLNSLTCPFFFVTTRLYLAHQKNMSPN